MLWQCEGNIVCRARIEQMKQNTLAGLYPDRIAVTQCFVVEGGGMIHDLQAIVRRRPFSYVLHAYKHRIPLMRGEKNFPVVIARITFRLDVKKSKLSRIQAAPEVFAGEGMGVIPTTSARLRRERILPRGAWSNHRCSLFHGAVHFRWNVKAVPVHKLRNIGVVSDVDGDLLSFFDAKQRTGRAAVIADRLNDLVR